MTLEVIEEKGLVSKIKKILPKLESNEKYKDKVLILKYILYTIEIKVINEKIY
jgi:hypothetical protein